MRVLNALGLILVLVMNVLADKLPLGGKTTGELSAQYPVLIMPAGYAFGIWLVIYALLIAFVVYSFTNRGRESKSVQAVGIYFVLSCIFNVGWLLAWHYEYVNSSVFIMLALLLSLIAIYLRINSSIVRTAATTSDRWLVRLPFSLYLGWICVATIVNVACALYAAEWQGFGLSEETWAIIMLSVAFLLALWIGVTKRDPVFMLVFVWAFVAIFVKQQQAHSAVAVTAILFAGIIAVCLAAIALRSSKVVNR
ncbi:tryptophan-rich sensory protein [Paenibacillus sp. YIM B09110]|uniref:tryptophan-rich sensory protein n=1 Tax=Paenibacillus sp. YIM B09110 TaxID=3126102 RepID=UPI00301D78A0